MTQEDVFVGIDVAKAWLDVAVLPTGETLRVANDRAGWRDLVARLRRLGPAAVAMEASGGYEKGVLRALLDAGLPARLVNPLRVRQFARACGRLAKTDAIDALTIARFVRTVPHRAPAKSRATEALAELVTARRQITQELTRLENQAAHAAAALLRRIAKARADRLKRDRLVIEKAIAAAIAADPGLAAKDALIRSVPGPSTACQGWRSG